MVTFIRKKNNLIISFEFETKTQKWKNLNENKKWGLNERGLKKHKTHIHKLKQINK